MKSMIDAVLAATLPIAACGKERSAVEPAPEPQAAAADPAGMLHALFDDFLERDLDMPDEPE